MKNKPDLERFLDMGVGDSIIQRAQPADLRRLADVLEKQGLEFEFQPQNPEPRAILVTRVR